MSKHYELGKKGEKMAQDFLLKKGYEILETNWRFQKAEVDIICRKEHLVVAVEVKTRSSKDFGNPQDFVNQKKIQLLVKAMNEYVTTKDLDCEVQFDIIAISKENGVLEIEHLEDAFYYF